MVTITTRHSYSLFLLIIFFLVGCNQVSAKSPHIPSEQECAPASSLVDNESFVQLSTDALAKDPLLNKYFSQRALIVANTWGMVPILREYLMVPSNTLQQLELRQQVGERIASINMKITSTSAELDCEEERADQIADYMLDVANSRAKNLTLASILLGALGSIVVGTLGLMNVNRNIYKSLGILFGLAAATAGFLVISSGLAEVSFNHQRNPLAELYHQPDSPRIFPTEVWNYINLPDEQVSESGSLRDHLLDRWQRSGELGAKSEEEKQRLIKLLFGTGGMYKAKELLIRANFFDQLESYVNLMKKDILYLSQELVDINQNR